jgi:uncharacterized protein
MKVTLNLTHRCNLRCRYCYAGRSLRKDMTESTAKRAIDFAFSHCRTGQNLEVAFFGGEPLLRFPLIRSITEYIQRKAEDHGRATRVSLTTNGTLLTQSVIDFLDREEMDVCVSIDGPKHIHNKNRCYGDGRGSFDLVASNLRRANQQLRFVQVNAVYGPDTLDALAETFKFFVDMGIRSIHLNPDIRAKWSQADIDQLSLIFREVAESYVRAYESGREVSLNMIDGKIIVFLKGGYEARDRCGMGDSEWAVAPSGNIYPCERFVGEDSDPRMTLGNVFGGWDARRRCSICQEKLTPPATCHRCSYRPFCMNWCGCSNYFLTGAASIPGALICASERAAIEASEHAFTTLNDKENELFFEHFMRYAHGSCQELAN